MLLTYLALSLVAAVVCALITPFVRSVAPRFGVVDNPGGRRVHAGMIPRLGGIAVFSALVSAVIVSPWLGIDVLAVLTAHGWNIAWITAGTVVVFAVGIADDLFDLPAAVKLGGHVVGAALTIIGGVQIAGFTNPLSGALINLGAFGGLVTMLWIVGITNAFNLIDGLDGLASGVALIATLTIAVLALAQERPETAMLALILSGALVGFLIYNFHPASIFLGDSGAFLLGYLLSVLAIQGLQKGPTVAVLLVPLLALGLPIAETLMTIQRRLARSARVFDADRDHIHHRLLLGGMNQRQAVWLLYSVCAGLGALACLSVLIGGPGSAVAAVLVGVAAYVGLRRLGYLSRAQ